MQARHICAIITTNMGTRPVLIVSNNLVRTALFEPPFSLAPEGCTLTGFDSLRFLALESYPAIVLHDPPTDLMRKLALGIHDRPEQDGLWRAINGGHRLKVYQLVASPTRPDKDFSALDIDTVTPGELRGLVEKSIRHPGISDEAGFPVILGSERPSQALTADDVRERFQRGDRSFSATQPMTDWAREVASSLGMRIDEAPAGYRLLWLPLTSQYDLKAAKETLFELGHRHPALLFLVPTPLLPIIRDLLPALRGRFVAPTVHWAEFGAFTGEVSIEMLIDMDCRGAIVSNRFPWAKPDHFQKLVQSARHHNLILFVPESLARLTGCDIMAPLPGGSPPGSTQAVATGEHWSPAQTVCFTLNDGRGIHSPEPSPGSGIVMTVEQLEG